MLKDNYSANMLLSVCLEIFPLNCLSPNLSNSSCAFTGLHTLFQGLDTMISRMGRYPRSTSENLFWVWCRQLLRKGTFLLLFFFWNMSYINHGSLEHLAAILLPRGEKLSENKTKQRLVFRFSVISFDSLGANSWRDFHYLNFPIMQANEIPRVFVCLFFTVIVWDGFLMLSTK